MDTKKIKDVEKRFSDLYLKLYAHEIPFAVYLHPDSPLEYNKYDFGLISQSSILRINEIEQKLKLLEISVNQLLSKKAE